MMDNNSSHPLIGQLRPIFAELHTCTLETLPSVILKLDYIIEEEKDALFHKNAIKSSTATAKVFPNWLNQQLRDLFAGEKTQLAGVRVLRSLLAVEYEDLNEMTKFFSDLLTQFVMYTGDYPASLEAVDVWGLLLNNGSSVVEGIINNCLKYSVSFLMKNITETNGQTAITSNNDYNEARSSDGAYSNNINHITSSSTLSGSNGGSSSELRHASVSPPTQGHTTKLAACLFVQQLVRRVPSAIVTSVSGILEALRHAIFDSNPVVRTGAADALFYTMRILYRSTDVALCQSWQNVFISDAVGALKDSTDASLHGALTTFNALLSSVTTRDADTRVVEFSPSVAKLVEAMAHFVKDCISSWPAGMQSRTREELLNTLPLLAKYNREAFKDTTVPQMVMLVRHVLTSTEGPDDRPTVFLTIARLTQVMPEMVPIFLDRIMSHVENSLHKRPNRDRCLEAVTCFATLSEVEPNAVRPFLRHIMGPLFAGPITEGFARDVAKICAVFPELRSTCLSKMLDSTKAQLHLARKQAFTGVITAEENRRFILANLSALSSLDFTGYSTLQFLCDAIIGYVSDPHEEVRRSAIDLCFKLVFSGCSQSPCERTRTGVVIHHGHEHLRLINAVVRKLVNAAVADSEGDIRLHTLERFTPEYDHTLALQDIASSLFPALHDKHQNRTAAVRLLGRISTRNPACVYPILRRVMVQCVTDIQLFDIPKKQEHATTVLSVLVESAPDMVRPYVSSLLNDCVARLMDDTLPVPVQTALLSCVGKLARYAEGDDVAVVAGVRSCVIGHILDSSNIQKKQEAITALGDIIRTTKDVDVYDEHPELLRVLLAALHGGFKETWPVRLDVLKLMGIIGAVDPVKVKEIARKLRDKGVGTGPLARSLPSSSTRSEEAVAQNVVRNVLDVLRLPSLTDDQCICAVNVIANVLSLKQAAAHLVSFYGDILAIILHHVITQEKIREKLLSVLARLVYLLGQHVRPYLGELLAPVVSLIQSSERGVLVEVLCLLSELRRSLREEFRPCLASVLPPIMSAVNADPARAGEPVFAFLVEMGALLDDYLHNILPCVCDMANNVTCPMDCRTAAVDALRNFAKRLPRLAFHAARCIHCLCRVLKEFESTGGDPVLLRQRMRQLHPQDASRLNTANNNSNNAGSGVGAAGALADAGPCGIEILIAVTLDAIRDVARNVGSDFDKFTPMVYPVLDCYGAMGQDVKTFVAAAVRAGGRVLASDISQSDDAAEARYRGSAVASPVSQNRGGPNGDHFTPLRNILSARDCKTEEDWSLWLKQISVMLLRSSPALSHGFAYPLAQLHEPFARHMLHSAFAVCYGEMDAHTREAVTTLLGEVLRSEQVPSEVLQELLNLSEYMERLEMRFRPKESHRSAYAGLLFDLKTLMESSERCNLYAKALHYVEIQFYETTRGYERGVMRGRPRPLPHAEWENLVQLCEKSIYLCNLLGQRESAEGMLKYIQDNFSMLTGKPPSEMPRMMDAQLFEKLQWWTQSYKAYRQGLQTEPNKLANMVGLMRSLDNLGDYGRLLESWRLFAPRVSRKETAELAPYSAHAVWLLRRWDDMGKIIDSMPADGYVGTTAVFYHAVQAIYKRQFHEAEGIIHQCRKRLDSTLSALVAESYDRAYGLFVGIQQLSELEEFAFVANNPHGLNHWQELWERRLAAMAYEGWSGTLANHTLVIPPSQELDMWLRFVSLSRVNGRERTSSEVLYELLGCQTIKSALEKPTLPCPAIALASFQHMYDTQEREAAIELLDTYLTKVSAQHCFPVTASQINGNAIFKKEDLAMCHSKLAFWLLTQKQSSRDDSYHNHSAAQYARSIRNHLEQATDLDSRNGAIWHTWARFNHGLLVARPGSEVPDAEHIVCAMEGYVRSVCLSQELEDVLGFLSLWFTYGSLPQVQGSATLQSEILQISPTMWLKVLPQIIARMHSRDEGIAESVYHLLVVIAKAHPQALLYNLNVTNSVVQSGGTINVTEQLERRRAAQRILARVVDLHHNGRALVSEATLVCRELVRCAVLWTELWYDELERACHQWYMDRSAQNVLAALQPLLQQLNNAETMAENHFVAEFHDVLYGACECVERAVTTGNSVYMEDAWTRFKNAANRIAEQIESMTSLSLQLISPSLVQNGRNLSIVVPGQYTECGAYPRIASFQSTLKVINSKQHPRRLYVNGTDGVVYKFLLKGHEDLRLDERVMQLLAFVNTLLEKHSAIQRRDCLIQVYSVTPLSDNAGLVGWVDHCDTLHQLIKEYRVHSRYLSIEINHMASFGVELDRLTVMQHVEPFEYALEQTEGTDLANSLWMRAPSAESWLDRRTTYVCSLATMSMVGHILGLGDRHPSNLMIHAFSGRVVHIDFGDCFEVAQNRSAFPEKVPFRLTRMLVKAMEMGGIEGLFRHGCITVMRVLREEGSSILALLEAFVHDPLVSWWREDPSDTVNAATASPSSLQQSQQSQSQQSSATRHMSDSASAWTMGVVGDSQARHGTELTVGSLRPRKESMARSTASFRAVTSASATQQRQRQPPEQGDAAPLTSLRHTSKEAQKVVNRIKEKLEGREYTRGRARSSPNLMINEEGLKVEAQVARLIEEATSNENLCVHFQGWCPFW